MSWECSNKLCFIKWLLNFFNVLMICAGIFIIFQVIKFINVLPAIYISFMIIMAIIIIACGVIGFVGIFIESPFIAKTYAIIMLVSIIVQVIGIFLASKFDDIISENARNAVEKQWNEELVHSGAMNSFQTEFKCCGNDSYNDYINILHRAEIPSSCFTHSNVTNTTLVTEGCFTGAEKTINSSFAFASRPDWRVVVFAAILYGAVKYLVIEFNKKKRQVVIQN